MTIEVTEAEASADLGRVPVCIGCHRPATGRGQVRLRTTPPGATPAGDDGLLAGVVTVLAVAADLAGRAAAKVTVAYPACWRHRWVNRPALSVADGRDGRTALSGVSDEFAAGWAATGASGS